MATFIPGYLGTVTLNSQDISAIGSVVSFKKTKNVMTKPTFGSAYGFSLGGQKMGGFSASGHVSAEQIGALNTMFDNAEIAFSLQIGTALGATDSGIYSGTCVVSDLTISGNADGEWDWSLDASTTGDVTYTAAV